jgi:hypothetical protein
LTINNLVSFEIKEIRNLGIWRKSLRNDKEHFDGNQNIFEIAYRNPAKQKVGQSLITISLDQAF